MSSRKRSMFFRHFSRVTFDGSEVVQDHPRNFSQVEVKMCVFNLFETTEALYIYFCISEALYIYF